MLVRKLNENEIDSAVELCWTVFKEFEAPVYSEQGINEFIKVLMTQNF